jgi:hypothetical protein
MHGRPPILVVLSAATEAIAFVLSGVLETRRWRVIVDTSGSMQSGELLAAGGRVTIPGQSILIFNGEA